MQILVPLSVSHGGKLTTILTRLGFFSQHDGWAYAELARSPTKKWGSYGVKRVKRVLIAIGLLPWHGPNSKQRIKRVKGLQL